jgi:hypothetical protein
MEDSRLLELMSMNDGSRDSTCDCRLSTVSSEPSGKILASTVLLTVGTGTMPVSAQPPRYERKDWS